MFIVGAPWSRGQKSFSPSFHTYVSTKHLQHARDYRYKVSPDPTSTFKGDRQRKLMIIIPRLARAPHKKKPSNQCFQQTQCAHTHTHSDTLTWNSHSLPHTHPHTEFTYLHPLINTLKHISTHSTHMSLPARPHTLTHSRARGLVLSVIRALYISSLVFIHAPDVFLSTPNPGNSCTLSSLTLRFPTSSSAPVGSRGSFVKDAFLSAPN